MNWSLLRLPPFRSLWTGRLLSWIGSGIGPLALAFAALDLGASPTELGLVVASRSVANVALVFFGPALTDRAPKWIVAVGASALSALALAAGALLLATGQASLPLLGVAGAVSGAGAALFGPATTALVGDVLREHSRGDGSRLNQVGMNLGLIVGAAVGGGLIAAFSPEIALATASLLFTAAIAAFAGLPRRVVGSVRGTRFAADLRGGLGFVVRTPWLLATVILVFLAQFAFAAGVQVLGPIAADHSFGRALWGFAGSVQTLGLVIGAAFAGGLRNRLRLATSTLGILALALPLLVLALIFAIEPGEVDPLHWFFWLSVALLAAGIGLEAFMNPLDATIRLQVPRGYLPRVYAWITLATLAGMPVGQIVVGPIVGLVGLPLTLFGLVALVVVGVAVVVFLPRVRRVDPPKVSRPARP
jgi:MFS family permease